MSRQIVSSFFATLLGLAQGFLFTYCWAYIAAYTPLPLWVHNHGLHGVAARAVIFPIDFLTSVVLSLPAALLLITLRPAKLRLYLVLAVVPSFLLLNYRLVGNPYSSQFFWSFALGWLPELLALPAAVWLMQFVLTICAPNNSLKRTAADRLR